MSSAIYTTASLQTALQSISTIEGRAPYKVIERALLAYRFAQHYAHSHHIDFDQLLVAQQKEILLPSGGNGPSPNSSESHGGDNDKPGT